MITHDLHRVLHEFTSLSPQFRMKASQALVAIGSTQSQTLAERWDVSRFLLILLNRSRCWYISISVILATMPSPHNLPARQAVSLTPIAQSSSSSAPGEMCIRVVDFTSGMWSWSTMNLGEAFWGSAIRWSGSRRCSVCVP